MAANRHLVAWHSLPGQCLRDIVGAPFGEPLVVARRA
jgi:hypothetical protein